MSAIETVHIIGMGEVGRRLSTALELAGVTVNPVTRSSGWERVRSADDALRLVCVRENDLPEVLAALAGVPARQIVLVQNGWIRDLVAGRPEMTRGLIWFTAKGDFFRELRPSPFAGPMAIPLVRALARGGLSVTAAAEEDFAALDAEKMGFNCVVGLPLAVSGLSLAAYLAQHSEEAEAVFDEAVSTCAAAVGQTPDADWWPAFARLEQHLGWVTASRAKALEYRNGAVVELGRRLGIPTPVNQRLLADHEQKFADG